MDAFAERLKGELSGAAAAAAYGLTRAGNGSLRSITSLNPAQAPATSSVPPATGSSSGTLQPSLMFVWLILTCVHFSLFLCVFFPNHIVIPHVPEGRQPPANSSVSATTGSHLILTFFSMFIFIFVHIIANSFPYISGSCLFLALVTPLHKLMVQICKLKGLLSLTLFFLVIAWFLFHYRFS